MLDTGGDKFDFNWIGLYASDDDVVVSIAYLPTQTKDPSVAMTRNFMLEFSGAAETTDINVDAESWQVDFSARMDGTDERVRQLSEDTIGRQLFYGDACKVSAGENGYYNVASGTGHVAGIRFNYVEKSVLVTKFPSSIWMDVWQRKNSMSDIEPEAVAVVSQTDRVDYLDGDGVWHYLEKVAEVESSDIIVDCRRLNSVPSAPKPDFYLPLINDIHIREGLGSTEFRRDSGIYEINKDGEIVWLENNEPRFQKNGCCFSGVSINHLKWSEDINKAETYKSRVKFSDATGFPIGGTKYSRDGESHETSTIRFTVRTLEGIVTSSIFIKPDVGTDVWLGVVNRNGTKYLHNSRIVDLTIGDEVFKTESLSDGLFRVQCTYDCGSEEEEPASSSSGLEVSIRENGGVQDESIFIGGWQLNDLPFAGAYCKTEDSPSETSVESLKIEPVDIPLAPPYTYSMNVYCLGVPKGYSAIFTVGSKLRWDILPDGKVRSVFSTDGNQGTLSVERSAIEKPLKITMVHDIDNIKAYADGILVNHTLLTTDPVRSTDRIIINGDGHGGRFYGWINDLNIYRKALSAEQVLALGVA